MNILLHPSVTLSIALILLIVFAAGIMNNSKIISVIISRLFLLIGTVIFADNFYAGHYGSFSILESGSIYFELGVVTLIIAPLLLTYRKKKQVYHTK